MPLLSSWIFLGAWLRLWSWCPLPLVIVGQSSGFSIIETLWVVSVFSSYFCVFFQMNYNIIVLLNCKKQKKGVIGLLLSSHSFRSNLEASDILVVQRHQSQDKKSLSTCSHLLFLSPALRSQPPTTLWVETPAASQSGVTGGWLSPALFYAVTQPPCRARGSFATCGRAAPVRASPPRGLRPFPRQLRKFRGLVASQAHGAETGGEAASPILPETLKHPSCHILLSQS